MRTSKVLLIKRKIKLRKGREVTYWALRWPNGTGGTCTESLGRKDELSWDDAKDAQRKKMIALGLGKIRHKRQKIMLAAYLEQDRESIKSEVKPATIVVHKGVSAHIIAAIGDIELGRVGWNEVARLKSWLSKEHTLDDRKLSPCSTATIRRTIVTLKAAFNRAMVRGLTDANPFIGRLAKVQPKAKRIYSHDEVDAMVEAAPDLWWRCFIRLAFTSGLRVGEILNLHWSDIDEEAGTVTVSAKRAGTFTAGGSSYPILAFSCKSHRERQAPLLPEVAKMLQRMKMMSGGSVYPFLSLNRLAILAASQDTTQEIPANKLVNNLLRTFRKIQAHARAIIADRRGVALAEVEWRVGNLHDFRKSFGTLMAHHVSMPELQRLMGHASVTTTADFYVDVSDDLAEKVQAAFAG